MKKQITVLCALAFAASLATVSAATSKDKPAPKPAKAAKTTVKDQSNSPAVLTIRVRGQITDAPFHLMVIDNESIRRSGCTTVSQLLNQQGVRR